MRYKIKMEKLFIKRMDNLGKLFHLSNADTSDARETIIDAIANLADGKELPEGYNDHILEKEPWIGYHEFHVFSDLLVVYYKVDRKNRIRMITITDYEELTTGKLPD